VNWYRIIKLSALPPNWKSEYAYHIIMAVISKYPTLDNLMYSRSGEFYVPPFQKEKANIESLKNVKSTTINYNIAYNNVKYIVSFRFNKGTDIIEGYVADRDMTKGERVSGKTPYDFLAVAERAIVTLSHRKDDEGDDENTPELSPAPVSPALVSV
jgi:hypothetical protein